MLNLDITQVICQGCRRRVAFDFTDCPWCGASLAYSRPTLLPGDSSPSDTGWPWPGFEQPRLSLSALQQIGLPLDETTYLAIGGGLGSFTWADHLVIHGADPRQIVAIGLEAKPYARCRRLCRNSQIPDHERLRSDSGATPDNIWGWPGYAVREIWTDVQRGRLRHAAKLAWQIFSESALSEPFTPKAGQVFDSVDRETERIGWPTMWRFGRVYAIRKMTDGRYVVAYSQTTPRRQRPRLIIAPYLHLAVGYPRLRFLPDLQAHRLQTGDSYHFVNAYEPHDHVYEQLRQRGGTVLLRGRGIVASRILQRLDEERRCQPNLHILHLMRQPIPGGATYQGKQRLAEHHFELQPFNFPKSSFGGDLRFVLEQAGDQERAALIERWGGTTTANRRDWRQIVQAGLEGGWYQSRFGQIEQVELRDCKLATVICGQGGLHEKMELPVDFIIDATGLDNDPAQNPLLKDLLQTYHLPRNSLGQFKVTPEFEISGLQNGLGRVFAAGIMTVGGYFAPVDSFVGLQYAAQRSIEALSRLNAPGLRRLNLFSSTAQWLRWARGVRP